MGHNDGGNTPGSRGFRREFCMAKEQESDIRNDRYTRIASPEIRDILSLLANISSISFYRKIQYGGKNRISYACLHNLSSVDVLFGENKRKRWCSSQSSGIFKAERVITSWEDPEVRLDFQFVRKLSSANEVRQGCY